MPANTVPIFGLTPVLGRARPGAANTASDGSGAVTTVFTAGANGSRVDRIRWRNSQATAAASSAMVVRVFISDNAGANYRLLYEDALPAATRTTAVVGAKGGVEFPGGLLIPTGTLLGVVQSVYAGVQDLVDFVAEGCDF